MGKLELWFSLDGGVHWQHMTSFLPSTCVPIQVPCCPKPGFTSPTPARLSALCCSEAMSQRQTEARTQLSLPHVLSVLTAPAAAPGSPRALARSKAVSRSWRAAAVGFVSSKRVIDSAPAVAPQEGRLGAAWLLQASL